MAGLFRNHWLDWLGLRTGRRDPPRRAHGAGEVQTRSKFGRSGFEWDPFSCPTPILHLEPSPRGAPRSDCVAPLVVDYPPVHISALTAGDRYRDSRLMISASRMGINVG